MDRGFDSSIVGTPILATYIEASLLLLYLFAPKFIFGDLGLTRKLLISEKNSTI